MKSRERLVKQVQLANLASPKVKTYLEKGRSLAILPVGSLEQHGPHAPLGTDTFICFEIGNRLALKLGGVILPPVWFGVSREHMDFAGTITLSPDTFCNLIDEVVTSLVTGGFEKVLVLNGHGGNERHLTGIRAQTAGLFKNDRFLQVLAYWAKLSSEELELLSSFRSGFHANAFETSIISAIAPGMVRKLKGISNFPVSPDEPEPHLDEKGFRQLIKDSNGVWGDPEQASIKQGKALLKRIETTLISYLEQEFA